LYLDYVTSKEGWKRNLRDDYLGGARDLTEHSFSQVITAFRRFFPCNSSEFEELMARLHWDSFRLKWHINYNANHASEIYMWIMGPLISKGTAYFNIIVALFPDATAYPMGDTLLDPRAYVEGSKYPGYFYLKLAVQLDAEIFHQHRNTDASVETHVRDAVDAGKLGDLLSFIQAEYQAPYMQERREED
jgi:hypothetical protein